MTLFHNLKKLKNLHALIEECLYENTTKLTNFTKLLKDVVVSDNGKIFQDIQFLNFDTSSNSVEILWRNDIKIKFEDGGKIFGATNKLSFQKFK